MKPGLLAVALVLALAAGARAETLVSSEHVELHSDVAHRPLLEKLVATVERALPVYEKHVPGLSLKAGQRLVFHLFARAEDYVAACRERGAPEMRERAGFTEIQGESWLLLQPRSEPAFLARVGDLPETTALLACHEGLHQWLAKTGGAPQDALLPAWYCEGMAEHVSAECVGASAVHVAEKPVAALEALAARRLLGVSRLVRADLATFDKKALLYSHAASFYSVLAAEPEKLDRLHAAIRAIPAPAGDAKAARFDEACVAALEKIYGSLDVLEERFEASLARARVEWFEDGACSQLAGDAVICAGASRKQRAILVSNRLPAGDRLELACDVEVLGLGARQAAFYLGYEGREDHRFLELALASDARSSWIDLRAFSDGYWQPIVERSAALPAATFAPGKKVPVRVSADKERIRVTSGGETLFEAAVPAGWDILHRRWGLGARDEVVSFSHVHGP